MKRFFQEGGIIMTKIFKEIGEIFQIFKIDFVKVEGDIIPTGALIHLYGIIFRMMSEIKSVNFFFFLPFFIYNFCQFLPQKMSEF